MSTDAIASVRELAAPGRTEHIDPLANAMTASVAPLHPPVGAAEVQRLVSSFAPVSDEAVAVRPTALRDGTPPATASAQRQEHTSFKDWSRRYTVGLLVVDVVIAMLVVFATTTFYGPASFFSDEKVVVLVLGAALAWPLAIAVCRGYDHRQLGLGEDEFRAVLRAVVLALAAAAVPSALVDRYGVVALSAVAVPSAGALSLLARVAGRRELRRRQRLGKNVQQLVVVGSASPVVDLVAELNRDAHGMHVLGVCVPAIEREAAEASGLRVLGTMDDVTAVVSAHEPDAVAVTGGAATRHLFLKQLAWSLEGADVDLLVHPGLVEVAGPRMHIRPQVGLPLLHVDQPDFSGWRRFVKRATDLLLTSLFVIVFSPLFLAIALAVKLDGGGPVFYRQLRVGRDGSTFMMWKFRSMHVDADQRIAEMRALNPGLGLLFKLENDPRVTRVGKFLRAFSLDELPQLFNVLQGSMSLVGPRPPLQTEVDGYEHQARRRLLVTPGLTGLWQVSGRSLLSWEESIRLDLRYVENWTLTLDLTILWRTLFAVLTRRGAF